MTSLNGATGRSPRHHTHRTQTEADRCPLCGSPISADARARLEEKLHAHVADAEQILRDQFAREQQQAAAKAAVEVARAKADAAAQVEKARKEAAKAAAATLAPKIAEAVNAERTKMFSEKLAMEQQLEEMKRRLQRRSANDIGEPAEVDLHAALAAALPGDRVSRVAKGVKGPDVVVQVISEGNIAGKIILDSKDHLRWSNKFTSKLRADQLAEMADFAILSSSVFPAGARELHIQDNVIVASPARVVVLVFLLRRQIIENYRLKLSGEARNEKGAKLLTYIASAGCADLFERVVKQTADLLDIEQSDAAWQEKTRNRRTGLIHGVQIAHDELVGTINRILASTESAA